MNETATYNSSIGQLIEPEPIGYSFNTPGWYLVFGLLVLTALVIAIIQYRKYRKNAYRREAVKEIENIIQQKSEAVVFEINILLKRMAIQLFGRQKVAALYGLEWFEFLVSTSNNSTSVSAKYFENFTKALYNNTYKLKENELIEFVEFATLWIKKHRKINV